jgi:hypothetical protein
MQEHMPKRPDMYDSESIEDYAYSQESIGTSVSCHLSTLDFHDHWDMIRCSIYLTANFAHLHFLHYALT